MAWKSYHTKRITDPNLYKFVSQKWLDDFLKTGSIWFARADKFGDKLESVRIQDLKRNPPNYKMIEDRKRKFLISCWHLSNTESLAFWDTYAKVSEERKNFAIRFERTKLIELFSDYLGSNDRFYYKTKWIHGKVLYKNLLETKKEELSNLAIKYPVFRKEKAFKYENEYRFVVHLQDEYENEGYAFKIGEPKQLPFEILINPLLKKNEFAELERWIRDSGFTKNLAPSTLTQWLRPDLW